MFQFVKKWNKATDDNDFIDSQLELLEEFDKGQAREATPPPPTRPSNADAPKPPLHREPAAQAAVAPLPRLPSLIATVLPHLPPRASGASGPIPKAASSAVPAPPPIAKAASGSLPAPPPTQHRVVAAGEAAAPRKVHVRVEYGEDDEESGPNSAGAEHQGLPKPVSEVCERESGLLGRRGGGGMWGLQEAEVQVRPYRGH